MNCMIEIMKIRKNKHLQKKKMSVSAYFISDLCNVHKIKRLSQETKGKAMGRSYE